MRRIWAAAILAAFAGGCLAPPSAANAQSARPALRSVRASPPATEISAQRRNRPPATRLRVYPTYQPSPDGVYPRYFPGRNAVRDCSATYLQEFRPSGTVIVPHMSCYWRRG